MGEQNDWALVVEMTVQESEGVTPKVGVVGRKVVPQRDTLWLSGADAINLVFGIIIHVVLTRVWNIRATARLFPCLCDSC